MPRYKLHYFNVRARAESIRILLTLAGADWEDTRIHDKEKEWKPMKESSKVRKIFSRSARCTNKLLPL